MTEEVRAKLAQILNDNQGYLRSGDLLSCYNNSANRAGSNRGCGFGEFQPE